MTSRTSDVIEAAGGVLWRRRGPDVEIALVHRPKYDDWSLPKGKLHTAETPLCGAVREVAEETGFRAVPGRPLGEQWYEQEGRPKRVRFWAMSVDAGEFVPNAEVDVLEWRTPEQARARMTLERDRRVLADLLADPVQTWPLVVLRHASAGRRRDGGGADRDRPLDAHGRLQAEGLVRDLALYRPLEVWSAGHRRCVDTLADGFDVQVQPLLEEGAPMREALGWLQALAAARRAAVVCTQRGPLPRLAEELVVSLGGPRLDLPLPGKGARLVLHLAHEPRLRVAALEQVDAPV